MSLNSIESYAESEVSSEATYTLSSPPQSPANVSTGTHNPNTSMGSSPGTHTPRAQKVHPRRRMAGMNENGQSVQPPLKIRIHRPASHPGLPSEAQGHSASKTEKAQDVASQSWVERIVWRLLEALFMEVFYRIGCFIGNVIWAMIVGPTEAEDGTED